MWHPRRLLRACACLCWRLPRLLSSSASLRPGIAVGLVTLEGTDVGLYRHYGEAVAGGSVPDPGDLDIEYPPGSLPLFIVPALLTGTADSYRHLFEGGMVVAIAATVVAVRWLAARATGEAIASYFGVLVLVAIVGSVALTRFDAVPAALSILALCGLVAGQVATRGRSFSASPSRRSSTPRCCYRWRSSTQPTARAGALPRALRSCRSRS